MYLLKFKKNKVRKIDITGDKCSTIIYQGLKNDKPFLVARLGANEFNCMTGWLQSKKSFSKYFDYITSALDYYEINDQLVQQTYSCAGVFPPNRLIMEKFAEQSYKDMEQIDILGVWLKEQKLLKKELSGKKIIPLNDIEPYFHNKPWSRALKGKRVLVIHPFATSIRSQYKKRTKLFSNEHVLPDFELITLRAVQSIAGQKTPYNNWFEALAYMKSKIDEIDFDIAIIGCGAYGLSLGAYVKSIGKKAIHMGGATQILFGIKGKRWDDHPIISSFYNEHWIKPLPEETPENKDSVEEGCYW